MSLSPAARVPLLVAVVFVVAWMALLKIMMPTGPSTPFLQPLPSPPEAEYNWTVRDLEGKAVDFSTFRGKVVFLNMWATWCGPCRAEMPSIDKLAANPRLKDVAFACVALDDEGKVKEYVRSQAFKAPVYIAGEDGPPPPYRTDGIPATFILSPEGKVVTMQIGSAAWDGPEVVDYLESLLPKQPGS